MLEKGEAKFPLQVVTCLTFNFSIHSQQMLSKTDDKMDVNEDFVEGVCNKNIDTWEPSSEEDAEGKEDEENEDAPNPKETYVEKEIEGDFEWVFLYNSSFG